MKSEYVHGYESLLQASWALVFDFDHKIESFYEEPMKVKVMGASKEFKYYPDFKVLLEDGSTEFIEIKPYRISEKEKILNKHHAIEEYFNEIGHRFRVLTEKDLNLTQLQLANLRRIRLFALSGKTPLEELKRLAPTKPTTFAALEKKAGSGKVVMELLGRQLARFDLNKKITDKTEITAIKTGDYYEFY